MAKGDDDQDGNGNGNGNGNRNGSAHADAALSHRPPSVQRVLTRHACDACRKRKARCEQSSVEERSPNPSRAAAGSCQRCTKFGLECTFLLPVKSRGPLSRDKLHASPASAAALETARGETLSRSSFAGSPSSAPTDSESQLGSPSSYRGHAPTNDFDEPFSTLSSQYPRISSQSLHPIHPQEASIAYPTDVICNRRLIKEILGDYFQHVYPLIPIVHRPSCQRDIANNRDLDDEEFSGLVCALCATTIAILPSKFQKFQKLKDPPPYADRKDMIYACYDKILRLRGHDYFEEINYIKWATSYLMCIAFFHLADYNRSRMIGVETNQLARLLNLHKVSEYDGLNCIEIQLRKKAFWLTFYAYVHDQLQFLRRERLSFVDQSDVRNLPFEALMPNEVDDEYIHEHAVLPQPPGTISLVTGFNLASQVFIAALTSTQPDEPCHCLRSRDPRLQIQHLYQRLHDLKYILDDVPASLQPWVSVDEHPHGTKEEYESRCVLNGQFASLRANLHVTHLWFQSLLSDHLEALLESQVSNTLTSVAPARDAKVAWAEREDLCRQLLHLLHSIPSVHLEPNGHVIVCKIRDVASSLLTMPPGIDAGAERRATAYLRAFSDLLSKLDERGYTGVFSLQSWIDGDRRYRT